MHRQPTRRSLRHASLRRARQLPHPRPHQSRPRRVLAVRDHRDCCKRTKPRRCRTILLPTCHNARSITPCGWDALYGRPELFLLVTRLDAGAEMRMRGAACRGCRAAAASPDKRASAACTATKAGRDRRVMHTRYGGRMSSRSSLPSIARRYRAMCGTRGAAKARGERRVPCRCSRKRVASASRHGAVDCAGGPAQTRCEPGIVRRRSCESMAPAARRLTRVACGDHAVGSARCATQTGGNGRASCA